SPTCLSSLPPSALFCLFLRSRPPRDLPSFPTRRSSDLAVALVVHPVEPEAQRAARAALGRLRERPQHQLRKRHRHGDRAVDQEVDRKSTRLNSSHVSISYAVFCLKKKKQKMYSREPIAY